MPAESSRSASVNVIAVAASQTPNHTTALLSNPHTRDPFHVLNHVPRRSHANRQRQGNRISLNSCRGNPTQLSSGMSTDLLRYDGNKSNIMTTTAAPTNRASNIIPDHDTAMSAKKEGSVAVASGKKKMDKNSMEYLIKSGVAGGFAGCAVCQDALHHMKQATRCTSTNSPTGKDGSRPPRPRKNPLPNPQPPVREIRRLLEWFPHGNPRHLRQHRSTWSLQGSLGNTPPHFPLCRHQIPRLRANTRSHNKEQSARNPRPTVHLGQFSRHDERLPDIPPRGNPRATRL